MSLAQRAETYRERGPSHEYASPQSRTPRGTTETQEWAPGGSDQLRVVLSVRFLIPCHLPPKGGGAPKK